MQRLFSMFPQGGPGFALLLLRVSVAVVFVINTANRFRVSSPHPLYVCILLISISLTIGFLTPVLSVITCASAIADLAIGPRPSNLIYIFPMVDAIALALLGPGAYSVDARLFGRRVTNVLRRTDIEED